MIETRYHIEYIDPNSGKPSSKLGKFFIYTTLSISILAAIIALFFSNLPNSTSQIITDKVQHFISSFNESSVNPTVVDEANTTNSKKIEIDVITPTVEFAHQTLISTQAEKEYKQEIERLRQENTTQDNEKAKHLQTNKALSKRLDQLSKQLKEENQKKIELTKKLATLITENQSVSILLNETNKTAENYAKKLKQLKQKVIVEAVKPQTVISEPKTSKIAEKVVKKPVETEETGEKLIVEATTNDIDTRGQKTPQVSQMDAIVAAMEAANNTSNAQNTKANNSNEKK